MSTDWLNRAVDLAMSALLARIDMARGGRPYFWVDFRSDPPQAQHSYWDYCDISARFVDALVLARLITGRTDGTEQEALLRNFLWAQQDESDGLFYNPEADNVPDAEMSKYEPDQRATAPARHVDMFCQRAPLLAMTTLLAADDEAMQPRLQRMVRGLLHIAERNGDEVRFPTYRWAPVLKPGWTQGVHVPERWQGYRYALLTGLARYAQISNDSVAFDLARGLALHYMRHGDVPPDGRFRANTHSGGVLPTAVGIARLGIAMHDRAMLEWVQRVYEWVREQSPDFGFVSDGLGLEGFFAGTCETCALADVQHLAILLTEAGLGDYWDDVERVARNQLIENQYADADMLHSTFPRITPDVLAMLHGGFECAAHPNHLLTWDGAEACCIGGGLRALYLTWRGALTVSADAVRVNMGISRSAPAVQVLADEPYQGRITVRVQDVPRSVLLRAPAHANLRDVRASIDEQPVSITWEGRYACFGQLRPGQTAALHYPLAEITCEYTIAGEHYTGHWRGHTMLRIAPPGERYPTYDRSNDRSNDFSRSREALPAEVWSPTLW